jgi:hypothetical protein
MDRLCQDSIILCVCGGKRLCFAFTLQARGAFHVTLKNVGYD